MTGVFFSKSSVRAALKVEKKLGPGLVRSGNICPANFGGPVKPYLKSMVLDLGSLDAGGVLRSNSTVGISYKS